MDRIKKAYREGGISEELYFNALVQLETTFMQTAIQQMGTWSKDLMNEGAIKEAAKNESDLTRRRIEALDDAVLKNAAELRAQLASYAIQVHSDERQDAVTNFVKSVEALEARV
jgi:hypothetical protein